MVQLSFPATVRPTMLHTLGVLSLALALAGCATPANHYDPLEPVNRKVYAFNGAIDRNVAQPIARGYVANVPKPVQNGTHNFFSNLNDVYVGTNNLLQGKWKQAGSDVGRVLFNSTFGLFGLIDIATPAGMPKHNEDFGQTLGAWGVGSGPYVVVPFLGFKTLRDTGDWVVSAAMDPVRAVDDQATRDVATALRLLNLRAELLGAASVVDGASIDEYAFVRDGYLQRRYSLVYDGKPPAPLKLGDEEEQIDLKDLIGKGQ